MIPQLSMAISKPPPPPSPPTGATFNLTFSDFAVLQREPSRAAVYGTVPSPSGSNPRVDVTFNSIKISADISDNNWIAYLPPTPAGGDYTITATCTSGCVNSSTASINHVTFGDVFYCSGQSNMWLPLHYTYARNDTVEAIRAGKYDNLRLMAGDSQRSPYHPWKTAKQAIADGNETSPTYSLFQFSAACWYTGQGLSDKMSKSSDVVPIGLISTGEKSCN